MATCHSWYHAIPQYTTEKWKTVRLLKQDQCMIHNQRWIHCLGTHVKNVILTDMDDYNILFTVLQKLLQGGCDGVESLEFYVCHSGIIREHHQQFLDLLRQLASSRLTHLMMKRHNWNFAFLKAFLPIHQYQIHLLQKSPRLQYLIGTGVEKIGARQCLESKAASLDYVLTYCPHLICYVGDCSYYEVTSYPHRKDEFIFPCTTTTPPSAIATNDVNNNEQRSSFYHLAICEHDNYDLIVDHLKKLQNTLTCLKLVGSPWRILSNRSNWASTLNTIRPPHLTTLHLDDLDFENNAIVSLLNTCHATMERIHLDMQPQTLKKQYIDTSILRHLKTLPRVHTFKS
ncbi:hypothetical protein BDA99DRAFT_558290 [Phascolomyces articulosus]|uniref:F-box domain-containing protein n=1 Tax=Phascolomyces articulosus TaxID=60185 RepID=A0AAD5K3S3_9FUNG|nr:hypothetical protein BDA99DRAFT_558290 [Phascolomyces articulosus]